ncbi:hypothetical protein B7P43_G02492 [Cryptotermes secundus]|uniref:Uncharacterized protein n=1 Tax=Cryptotermes secundus TaxID=105785 RepID=A0A2J7Q504_9NEOP|nr:hypothetical protein B7P43_G02492 [Cryptotermes secundus]
MDMKVESVVKKVSPVPFDSGCTVEGSEGTLDGDDMPEFVGHEMNNVADKNDPFSGALFSHISDESNIELEESQTTQCDSDSLTMLQDSYDQLQSKSNVSAPKGCSLVLNQPSCTSTNHSASSQILNILKVSSDMILFPANDVLNSESSSISAILPMDNKSSTDNRSASPLALQTDGSSQTGTLTSTTIDVSSENERNTSWTKGKLHMRENCVKVLPKLISTMSQESENCSGHINVISSKCVATRPLLESEKNFKECRMDSEENKDGRKCKLHTAVLNTRCQKYSNKISQRHCQAVNMSSIPETHKHSNNHLTNYKSDSGKKCELATQTVAIENDNDGPSGCAAWRTAVSKKYYFRRHVREHLHSLHNTRNMKHILEKYP